MSDIEEEYSFDDFHEDSGDEGLKETNLQIDHEDESPPFQEKANTIDAALSDDDLSLGPSVKFNDSFKYPDLSKLHGRSTHIEPEVDLSEIDEEISSFQPNPVHKPLDLVRSSASPLQDIPEQLVQPPPEKPTHLNSPKRLEAELIEDKAPTIMSPAAQKSKHIVHYAHATIDVLPISPHVSESHKMSEMDIVEEVPESVQLPENAFSGSESANNSTKDCSFDASKLHSLKMKAQNRRKRAGSDDNADTHAIAEPIANNSVEPVVDASIVVTQNPAQVVGKDPNRVGGAKSHSNPVKNFVSPLAKRKQPINHTTPATATPSTTVNNNKTTAANSTNKSIKDSIQNELAQLGLDALSPVHKKPTTNIPANPASTSASINTSHNTTNQSSHTNPNNSGRRVASTGTTTAITKQPNHANLADVPAAAADHTTNNPSNTNDTTSSVHAKPYNQKYEQIKKLRTEHATQKATFSNPNGNTNEANIVPLQQNVHSPIQEDKASLPTASVATHANQSNTNKYRPTPAALQSNRRISLKPALPARKVRPVVPTEPGNTQLTPPSNVIPNEQEAYSANQAAHNTSDNVPVPTATINNSNNHHMLHRKLRTPDVPPTVHSYPTESNTTSAMGPTIHTNNTHVASSKVTHTDHTNQHQQQLHQQQQLSYQPKPPANKPSVPRQSHSHAAPAYPKEQYLPASVLEENSTFSTLLDNSTYSEYNDAEYVLPAPQHPNNIDDVHTSNSTIKLTEQYNNTTTSIAKGAGISQYPTTTVSTKPSVVNSPKKVNNKTEHQHHNHVQFKGTDDNYSDHGDEEGIPMSAPTAGSELRPSDYRFPDTSRSATEHNQKHALYHNNPYTHNVPFVRNSRAKNVSVSKNKPNKSYLHPSVPIKPQNNSGKNRPKVVKYKHKSDWMADPSHRYDESTGLFSSYETDVKREARIEQARINAILRKQAQEREAEIARTAYLKRRHEAEMLQQLKEERQLQLQHQREQRNLEMLQLYGSPPNPHQHSPLPAVHPSYHPIHPSHPAYPAHYSPDHLQDSSYSIHSSGQSANGSAYYSGERSANYRGSAKNSGYANGNLMNGHKSPYSTPSPQRVKSSPRSHESEASYSSSFNQYHQHHHRQIPQEHQTIHIPNHHTTTKSEEGEPEDDTYSLDSDQESPIIGSLKKRKQTPKHSPQKSKSEAPVMQNWNNSVNTLTHNQPVYTRKGRQIVEPHAGSKNVNSIYAKPTAPATNTSVSKSTQNTNPNTITNTSNSKVAVTATVSKPVTNAPAHISTTATIHNVNLTKLFDVSTSSTVVEEHNLNVDSTVSPLYRNNSSAYFSSHNSSVVLNAPEPTTIIHNAAEHEHSYHSDHIDTVEKRKQSTTISSVQSSHNNSYDRIALLSAAASRVKVDLFGDEVDVNIIQNDIHHGLSITDTPPHKNYTSTKHNAYGSTDPPEDYYIEKVQSMLGIDIEDMKNIKIHSFYGDNSPRSHTTNVSNSSEKRGNPTNTNGANKGSSDVHKKGLSLEDAFIYAGELDLPDEGQAQMVVEEDISEQVDQEETGYDSYGDDDFEDEVTAGKGYLSNPTSPHKAYSSDDVEVEDGVDESETVLEKTVYPKYVKNTVEKAYPTVSSLTDTNTSTYNITSTTTNPTNVSVTDVVPSYDYEETEYGDEEFEEEEASRTASRLPSAIPNTDVKHTHTTATPAAAVDNTAKRTEPVVQLYESDYEDEFPIENEPTTPNNLPVRVDNTTNYIHHSTDDFTVPPDLDLSEIHAYAFADTMVAGEPHSVNSTLHSEYYGSLNGSPLLGLKLAPIISIERGSSNELLNPFGSTDVLDHSLQYSVGSNTHMYSPDTNITGQMDTGIYISQNNSVYDEYARTTAVNEGTTDYSISAEHNNDDYADDFDTEFEDPDVDTGILFTNIESTTEAAIPKTTSEDSGDGLTNYLTIKTDSNREPQDDIPSRNSSGANSGTNSPSKHHRHHKHKHHHYKTDDADTKTSDVADSHNGTSSPHKHHKHHRHHHKHHHKHKHYDTESDGSGPNSRGDTPTGGDGSGASSPSKHKHHHKQHKDGGEEPKGANSGPSSPAKHKKHDYHKQDDAAEGTVDFVGIADENHSVPTSPSKPKHQHKPKQHHTDADNASDVLYSDEVIADTVSSAVAKFVTAVSVRGITVPMEDTYSDDEYSFTPPITVKRNINNTIDTTDKVKVPAGTSNVPTEHNTSTPIYTPSTVNNVKKAKDSSFINTYDDDGLYGDYYFDDTVQYSKPATNIANPSTNSNKPSIMPEPVVAAPATASATTIANPTPYSVRNFSIAITDYTTAHNLASSLTSTGVNKTTNNPSSTDSKKVDLLARIQLNSMAYMEDDDSEFEEPESELTRNTQISNDIKRTVQADGVKLSTNSETEKAASASATLPLVYSNKVTSSLAPLPALSTKSNFSTNNPTSATNKAAAAKSSVEYDEFDHLFDTPTVANAPPVTNNDSLVSDTGSDKRVPVGDIQDAFHDQKDGYYHDEDHLEEDHSLEDESIHSRHSKHSKHKKHKKSKSKHKHKHKHRVTMIGAPTEIDDLDHSSESDGEDDLTEYNNADSMLSSECDHSPTSQLSSASPVRGNNNTNDEFDNELAFSPSRKHTVNIANPTNAADQKEKKHKHKKHKSKHKHKKHKESKNSTGESSQDPFESSLGTLDDLEEGSGDDNSSGDEEENLGEEEFDF